MRSVGCCGLRGPEAYTPLPATVVFLPGIAGGSALWRQVDLSLTARCPSLATCRMALPDDPRAVSLDAIAALLEPALPPGPWVIVGSSLGGRLALALAGRNPGRVWGVVTHGTLPTPALCPATVRVAARGFRFLPGPIWKVWVQRRWRAELRREGVGVQPRALASPGLTVAVHRARLFAAGSAVPGTAVCPLVWLRGEVDPLAPWSLEDIARLHPTAVVRAVSGGHFGMLSHHEMLVNVLWSYLLDWTNRPALQAKP